MGLFSGYSSIEINTHYVLLFVSIMVIVVLFVMRNRIAEAHDRWRANRRVAGFSRVNGDSFLDDFESGFNSDTFSITSNISSSDPRSGLLVAAKEQIREIMKNQHVSFDEARLQYTQSELSKHNIDTDGLPRDPKLVTF